jgi:S-(hydroxymethyl)glutathione dehydrogenase/alcohol dehydrogenase
MKTTAAVLSQIDRPLELWELELPPLAPGQVLVDVRYSSICHSQLNEIRGRKGEDKFLPHTLGHEGSGIVLETGPGVTKVKAGDSVVLTWIAGGGQNVPGSKYRCGDRVVNSGAVSTFLRRAVAAENRLVPIDGMPLELMPLLGCAIPTGFGLVRNNLKPLPGSSLAVWGVGGVGLSVVLGAKTMGCGTIIAVDIQPGKLELARVMGATHTVDGARDPVAAILEITGGKGVDHGVDCAGHVKTIEAGYAAVRKGGGRFVVAGNPPAGQKIAIDPMDLISGKHIAGTWGGETKVDADLPAYRDAFRDGNLPLEKLITHRESLERINDAIELMESGRSCRVLIDNGR